MKAMVNNIEIHHISPYFSLVYSCLMFSTTSKLLLLEKAVQCTKAPKCVVSNEGLFHKGYFNSLTLYFARLLLMERGLLDLIK